MDVAKEDLENNMYTYKDDNYLYFSSEVKAIETMTNIKIDLNIESLPEWALFGNIDFVPE